eukprot:360023-Chlamydomonas_euryale.AAC.3
MQRAPGLLAVPFSSPHVQNKRPIPYLDLRKTFGAHLVSSSSPFPQPTLNTKPPDHRSHSPKQAIAAHLSDRYVAKVERRRGQFDLRPHRRAAHRERHAVAAGRRRRKALRRECAGVARRVDYAHVCVFLRAERPA